VISRLSTTAPAGTCRSTWRVGLIYRHLLHQFLSSRRDRSSSLRVSETTVIPLTLAQKENQLNLLYKFFIQSCYCKRFQSANGSTALNTSMAAEVQRKFQSALSIRLGPVAPSTNCSWRCRRAGARLGFNRVHVRVLNGRNLILSEAIPQRVAL